MKYIITTFTLTLFSIIGYSQLFIDFEEKESLSDKLQIFEDIPRDKSTLKLRINNINDNNIANNIVMERLEDWQKERLTLIVEKVNQYTSLLKDSFSSSYTQKKIEIGLISEDGLEIIKKNEEEITEREYAGIDNKITPIKTTYDTIKVYDCWYEEYKHDTIMRKVIYEFVFKNILETNNLLDYEQLNLALESNYKKEIRKIKRINNVSKIVTSFGFGILSNQLQPIAPSFDFTLGYRVGRSYSYVGLNGNQSYLIKSGKISGLSNYAIEIGGMKINPETRLKQRSSFLLGVQYYLQDQPMPISLKNAQRLYYVGLVFQPYNSFSVKINYATQFKKNPQYDNWGIGLYYSF